MSAKSKKILNALLLNLLVILLFIFIVGPFVWMVVASMQGENELLKRPPSIIPRAPTWITTATCSLARFPPPMK